MSGELDEPTLIQSAQRGDLDAFNTLIDRYQDLLFRIARRMLGDEDNAADATQLAWISAFRKICEFRGGNLRTWLARVVVNTCYDEIRRRHRRREVPLVRVNADEEEIDTAYWLADPVPGVEESLDTAESVQIIDECLQTLAPAFRTMLVLVDIEGLSYQEAAIAARVPLGTVRSRLARARTSLRQRLQETADLWPARQRVQILPTAQAKVRYP
jgi:RNA polymerase sigma-70 factor (ECF subfamily)